MQDVTERTTAEREPDRLTTALLGAAAGAAGTFALDRADWWMWDHEDPAARRQTEAVRPNGEPPADVLVSRIEEAAGVENDEATHRALGQATHYAIGIMPAVGYALLRNRLPGRGVPRGLLYGGTLFLLQDEVLNSVTGLGAKPTAYPWQAHARGLVAHLVYGVATELALNAAEKALGQRRS
jgi:uncharacterized membrane protein YagU involved in acid resistance